MAKPETGELSPQDEWLVAIGVPRQLLAQVTPGVPAGTAGSAGPASPTASPAPPTAVQKSIEKIIISPENPLVESGERQVLTATAVYSDGGTEDITGKVVWKSSVPKVADFTSAGWCDADAAGTSTVTATDAASQISGSTKITVFAAGKAPKLLKVTISPLNPDIKDEPVAFKAMGVYADKSTHEITDRVKWESSNEKVVTINKKGVAKARLEEGQPLIRGSDPATGLYQSTTVYVAPSGVRSMTVSPKNISAPSGVEVDVTLTGALYGGGTRPVNELVEWTSSNPNVAEMIAAGTKVKGKAPGDATIEAYEPNSKSSDTFDIKVLPAVLDSIWVSPGDKPIPFGQKLTFEATGLFSDSTTKELKKLKWSADPPDMVDINQKGEATAKKAGNVTITAEDPATHKTGSVEVKAEGPP